MLLEATCVTEHISMSGHVVDGTMESSVMDMDMDMAMDKTRGALVMFYMPTEYICSTSFC